MRKVGSSQLQPPGRRDQADEGGGPVVQPHPPGHRDQADEGGGPVVQPHPPVP